MTDEDALFWLDAAFVNIDAPNPVVRERDIYRPFSLLCPSNHVASTIRLVDGHLYERSVTAGERNTALKLFHCWRMKDEKERKRSHAAVWVMALLHDIYRYNGRDRGLVRFDHWFAMDYVCQLEEAIVRHTDVRDDWHHGSRALPERNPIVHLYPGELFVPKGDDERQSFIQRIAAMCADFCCAHYTPLVFLSKELDEHLKRRE